MNTEVVVYTIEGGGHTWPGGTQYLPVFLVGKASHNLDGTQVIWEFFKKHKLP
jgi:polyhydroxybutyrate depolymerase